MRSVQETNRHILYIQTKVEAYRGSIGVDVLR